MMRRLFPRASTSRQPAAQRSFWREEAGIAGVEMALAAPVLLTLLLGTAEVANFLSTNYKVGETATTVSDVVARYQTVSSSDIKTLLGVSAQVMGRQDFDTRGHVILSSVSQTNAKTGPVVRWQCSGGGSMATVSAVGQVGKPAVLPHKLALDDDDNVIIAEVFYEHRPFFNLLPIGNKVVYKTAIFRPRLGALTTAPGC